MTSFNNISDQYRAIVIGGSAGSFQIISKILGSLPHDFQLPVIMCLHRLRHIRNGFVEALSIKSTIEVVEPEDKQTIKKNKIYLAPANYHLCIELGNTFALSTEELVNNSRPAIDLMMQTGAYTFRHKLIGILLSGANKDGALGMKAVHDKKGLTIAQDPTECLIDTMPAAAINATKIDYVLKVDKIIEFLLELHKQYKGVI